MYPLKTKVQVRQKNVQTKAHRYTNKNVKRVKNMRIHTSNHVMIGFKVNNEKKRWIEKVAAFTHTN